MTARLLVNPRHSTDAYGAAERAALSENEISAALAELRSWPDYAVTPLVDRPDLARDFGLGALAIKDEGARFAVGSFKALGPAYAATRLLQRTGPGATLARRSTLAAVIARGRGGERRARAGIALQPHVVAHDVPRVVRRHSAGRDDRDAEQRQFARAIDECAVGVGPVDERCPGPVTRAVGGRVQRADERRDRRR